jgi:hypothetical protein
MLHHSPSYSAKIMNEWSCTLKARRGTTLLCFYSRTRELYCVKRPLHDFTTFQTIFQFVIEDVPKMGQSPYEGSTRSHNIAGVTCSSNRQTQRGESDRLFTYARQ